MKKLTILFSVACMCLSMHVYADCGSVITPSQAATKAANGDQGTYCIEGYVVSTVDIYCKTSTYENQSFMMADAQGGAPVFEAWRVVGADHTIGIGSFVRIVDAALQMYGDVAETKAGFTVQIISEVPTVVNLPEYGSELTAAEAVEICMSLPYHDQPTEDMFVVSGYANSVVDINPENGIQTVYIADERGTGYIFQAWECQNIKNINGDYMPIEEGDFVYITGHLSRYNKNSQIKGGYVSRYAVDPFVVRVSADPDQGYATISGKYEFTLADMNDVQFTLTAIPEPGYEFVMWIDPQFVNPSDPDAATGMQVAETILQWYNTVTHFSEEQLQEYLAEEGMDMDTFEKTVALIDKIIMPETTLDIYDLEAWMSLNGINDQSVLYFMPVFRPVQEGIDNVQRGNVQSTKVIENGQLYLKYEGRMYDVQGAVVK